MRTDYDGRIVEGPAAAAADSSGRATMNEDVFNASIRKFLKTLGVTAQREIEKAVREAIADGRIKGNEAWPAKATISIPGIGLSWQVDGEIDLG